MKIFSFVLLLLTYSSYLLAQMNNTDSLRTIESEILKYQDTDLSILHKGRKMIIDNLENDKMPKVAEIYGYLKKKLGDGSIVPFWPAEEWYILLWTKQYSELFDLIKMYSPKGDDYYDNKIVPPRDLLFDKITQYTVAHKPGIQVQIQYSKLEREQEDFLFLFLEYLVCDTEDSTGTYENINSMADQYLIDHKSSVFNAFIRNYIRYVYTTSKWGYGLDLYFGAGLFDGNMSKYFKDSVIIGIGFDVSYRQTIMYFRLSIGVASEVLKTFEYNGTWKEGLKLNVPHPEISIGYVLLDNDTFKFAPFAGISALNIAPPEAEANKPGNDVDLGFAVAPTFGLNFDIKFNNSSREIVSFHESGFWSLRIRIGYMNPAYENVVSQFSGNMLYINIGAGGFARTVFRDF